MTGSGATSPAVGALLERAIDYAGLFPPARLSMPDAVRDFAAHRRSGTAWMLGRFVVPVSRLEDFEDAGETERVFPDAAADSWALSALVGPDAELDASSVTGFNDRHRDARRGAVHVDTVEMKAATAVEILAAHDFLGGFDAYYEVPVAEDPDALIAAIAEAGAKAKIRTGGVTANAIPGPRHVLRFMRRCLEHDVAFKATAGLHHPIRAEYPLPDDAGAPRGVMYGFLNILLAAALLREGVDDAAALDLLEERDPAAIHVDGDRLAWRTHAFDAGALRRARHDAIAFGSCSFADPVSDLRTMGWL